MESRSVTATSDLLAMAIANLKTSVTTLECPCLHLRSCPMSFHEGRAEGAVYAFCRRNCSRNLAH